MKRKLVLFLSIACLLFAVLFSSGCYKDSAAHISGTWQLDLTNSDDITRAAFKSAQIVIDPVNARGAVEAEISDDVKSTHLQQGDFFIRCYFISSFDAEVYFRFDENMGWTVHINRDESHFTNTVEVIFNRDFDRFEADTPYACTMVFVKTGASFTPVPTPTPTPTPTPSEKSKHEEIKTAYKNAGYVVDVSASDADASVAALIKSMQDSYAMMGVKMTCIGKDLNTVSLNTELYMLISADSESTVQELADGFKSAYKYEKKGKDIIVYIWTLGTPNFEPFKQAT